MSAITTHVLDTARGVPAAGVPVSLQLRLPDGAWKELRNEVTNPDGRANLATGGFVAGVYRIIFGTVSYMPDGLYPEVTVTFHVRDAARHYHIPLLLSPYGYTTYRGS